MSVIKRKRNVASTEYVMSFVKLYDETETRLMSVSKRRQRYICTPIARIMNEISNYIMQMYDAYCRTDFKSESKQKQAEIVISKIYELQKPLLSLWNITKFDLDRMIIWADSINKEIEYIAMYGEIDVEERKRFYILDYKAVSKMTFINKMCKLHKLIHQKVIHIPSYMRETKGNLLTELADDALYNVCEANRNFPTSKEIYDARRKHLSTAINDLKQMQRPLFALFNLMHYSEHVMLEISELLNTELKLLQGLVKSDKERFKQFQ